MTRSRADAVPAILATGIVKRFGPVVANNGAALRVERGEIHAVVGENGAGKSTLMRVLSGMYPPDAGRIEIDGRNVTGWNTREAIAAGVGMVHQHFMLVPTLTAAENVVLGREFTRGGGWRVDVPRAEREVRDLGERTGLVVPADRLVADLSVGEAQRVEILKTLFRGARILILDEPTAVLSPLEVRDLWTVLRTLRDDGGTIVLITHKLDEVIEISDTITVMRAGATVTRMPAAGTTPAEIARAMVGRDVQLVGGGSDQRTAPPRVAAAAPVLEVRDLVVDAPRRSRAVDGVSFSVAGGEVLGIAGVEGNGQTELIEAITGLRDAAGGRVLLRGIDLLPLTVRERAAAGLSHIPEDRLRRALVLEYTVAENLILGQQSAFGSALAMDRAAIAAHAVDRMHEFDVRPADRDAPARALSGGNQQKLVIAREMARDFSVLVAAQPTRGVDVGAIEFIHDRLRQARDAGRAILLVSADLAEVLALSDRVAVMYGGRIVVMIDRAAASAESLAPWMTGVGGGSARESA